MDFAALYNRGPSASLRDFVVDISVAVSVSASAGVSVSVSVGVSVVYLVEVGEYGVSRVE